MGSFFFNKKYKTKCLHCKSGTVILVNASSTLRGSKTHFDSYCQNNKCNKYNVKIRWELSDIFLEDRPGFVTPFYDDPNDIEFHEVRNNAIKNNRSS